MHAGSGDFFARSNAKVSLTDFFISAHAVNREGNVRAKQRVIKSLTEIQVIISQMNLIHCYNQRHFLVEKKLGK